MSLSVNRVSVSMIRALLRPHPSVASFWCHSSKACDRHPDRDDEDQDRSKNSLQSQTSKNSSSPLVRDGPKGLVLPTASRPLPPTRVRLACPLPQQAADPRPHAHGSRTRREGRRGAGTLSQDHPRGRATVRAEPPWADRRSVGRTGPNRGTVRRSGGADRRPQECRSGGAERRTTERSRD